VTWARGEYQSIRGPIACDWKLEGSRLALRVSVPANTSATICVPTSDSSKITESGKAAPVARTTSDCAIFEVWSGDYEFISPLNK
jgi:alpha-L-rhamnosidase